MKILIIIVILSLPAISNANNKELKICLTGSTEKALPKYGEAFVNGANLAINELNALEKKKVKIEVNYYESNPLAAIAKLDELRRASCDAIIGFSTGNDLLSIEDSLKEKPLFTLSIYGDPQERFSKTTYLRTMQPSASDLVSHLFKKLPFKITKDSKVLIVTAADRSEMVSYKEAYLKSLTGVPVTQVEVVEQTHDLRQFETIIQKKVKWDYVILLTRSLVAAELSDLIHKFASPKILGTKYFGSSDLPAFYNYLKNKNVEAYISRQNCSCETSKEFTAVREKYVRLYSVEPMSISFDAYDATTFVLRSLQSDSLDSDHVLKILNSKNADFLGVSSFRVAEGLKVSSSKRYLIKIDQHGYKEIK